VLAAADEWQLLRAGVGDVARDVEAVLSYPPQRYARRVQIFPAPEIDDEREWYDQLEESATQRDENFAPPAEDDVAGLMNRKIDCIGQVKAIRCQSAP